MDPWTTFAAAAHHFADLVGRIDEDRWDGPGLGVWDLRALIGHTSRALSTTASYLQRPAADEVVATPQDYYATVLDGAASDPLAVAVRGRVAGAALGGRPAPAVHALVGDVLTRLESREDRLVTTAVGGMRVSSYLPTRTFELAVHSLDIGAATGLVVDLPADVLAECAVLAAAIGVARGRGYQVLSGLTGRDALPAGFTVMSATAVASGS